MIYADHVRETSATTGTGSLTLAGAATGFRTFASAFAVGDQVYYGITSGSDFEVGVGTLTGSTTLSRDVVLSSSNSGALVSLASSVDVYATLPAVAVADRGYNYVASRGGLMV